MALTAAGLQRALIDRGYPPHVAAGITANAQAESSFDPGAHGDGGTSIGLFQWHGSRADALRQFAAGRKRDWRDIEVQLDFLGDELSGGLRSRLDSTRTAEDASREFTLNFERPADAQVKAAKRAETAGRLFAGGSGFDPFEGWTVTPARAAPAQRAADPFEGWTTAAPAARDPFEGWHAVAQAPSDPFEGWHVAEPPAQSDPFEGWVVRPAPQPQMAEAQPPAPDVPPQPQRLQAASAAGSQAIAAGMAPAVPGVQMADAGTPQRMAEGQQHWSQGQSRDELGRWSGGFA